MLEVQALRYRFLVYRTGIVERMLFNIIILRARVLLTSSQLLMSLMINSVILLLMVLVVVIMPDVGIAVGE